MPYFPDGRIEQYNVIPRHIETLNKGQVIECLKLVLDPEKFQYVDHWKGHQNRSENARRHLALLKRKGMKRVDAAKKFLISICSSDPFNECEAFLDVGDYVEVIHRVGQPPEYRRKEK